MSCPSNRAQSNVGKSLRVPMSGRYSISTCIKEAKPQARITMDIIAPKVHVPERRSRMGGFARSIKDALGGKQCINIDSKGNANFVALMGTLQIISMQHVYAFRATVLAPEPKNQTEARG
eukprot:3760390-Rhodomonas_salina.1